VSGWGVVVSILIGLSYWIGGFIAGLVVTLLLVIIGILIHIADSINGTRS